MFARAAKNLTIAQVRAFSVFAGAEANQTVYAAGKITRDIDGKKITVPVATEFKTIPSINVVINSSFYGAVESSPAEALTETYLVDANGAAAKVKAISVEDYITAGTVKFTGGAYKWTGAKVSQTLTNGSAETEYTFGDSEIGVSGKKTVGSVNAKDAGSLKVVSRAEFDAVKAQINAQIIGSQ